jgi:hypothetical protein
MQERHQRHERLQGGAEGSQRAMFENPVISICIARASCALEAFPWAQTGKSWTIR